MDQWVISPTDLNGVFLGVKSPTDPITFDPFTSNGTSKYEQASFLVGG